MVQRFTDDGRDGHTEDPDINPEEFLAQKQGSQREYGEPDRMPANEDEFRYPAVVEWLVRFDAAKKALDADSDGKAIPRIGYLVNTAKAMFSDLLEEPDDGDMPGEVAALHRELQDFDDHNAR